MRILQYNILNGCQDDPDRLKRLGAWLKQQAYDVVGLNELNGWNQLPGMLQLAQDWGYSHAELFVTERSPRFVGVLSKHPIKLVETREASFNHGLLHVIIRGVHYLVTHLTPVDTASREKETAVLAEIVSATLQPLVLMGDMNTLSLLDQEEHAASGLADVLRRDSALRRKFLTSEQIISYRPMQQLLDAGLRDLGATVKAAYSVPTAANRDKAHAARMRLDYILVNEAFLGQRPEVRVRILHNEEVDTLSDHYPVECVSEE